MTALLDALKTLATQEETPSDDERAIDAIIAQCDGDARIAAMSLLKISRKRPRGRILSRGFGISQISRVTSRSGGRFAVCA